jgi:hypothetical protein
VIVILASLGLGNKTLIPILDEQSTEDSLNGHTKHAFRDDPLPAPAPASPGPLHTYPQWVLNW